MALFSSLQNFKLYKILRRIESFNALDNNYTVYL